jgi:hypothetical protein
MADKVPVMAKNPAQYGSEKGCPQHRPYDCAPHCDRCNDWRQLRELRADLARVKEERDTAQRMYNDRWGQLQAAQAETERLRERSLLAQIELQNALPWARETGNQNAATFISRALQALASDPEPKR